MVLGLIAGFIGSKLVNKTGEGFFLDIALGIVGAVIGGWLFNLFGMHGVTGVNVYSLIVAVIGAVVFLMVYHAIRRARSGRPRKNPSPVLLTSLLPMKPAIRPSTPGLV